MAYNSKVKFHATRRPWAAHGNIPELDYFIAIDKFLAGRFLDSSPDLTTNFRQYVYFDVVVFKFNYLPFLFPAFVTITVERCIRKNLRGFRTDGHYRTGVVEWVGKDFSNFLGYAGR